MLQNKFLELIVTISIDDKLSSTFCIVQNKYQKNIRISDFKINDYKIFMDGIKRKIPPR